MPLRIVHDALEHAPEDVRVDVAPVRFSGLRQRAELGVSEVQRDRRREEPPVEVRNRARRRDVPPGHEVEQLSEPLLGVAVAGPLIEKVREVLRWQEADVLGEHRDDALERELDDVRVPLREPRLQASIEPRDEVGDLARHLAHVDDLRRGAGDPLGAQEGEGVAVLGEVVDRDGEARRRAIAGEVVEAEVALVREQDELRAGLDLEADGEQVFPGRLERCTGLDDVHENPSIAPERSDGAGPSPPVLEDRQGCRDVRARRLAVVPSEAGEQGPRELRGRVAPFEARSRVKREHPERGLQGARAPGHRGRRGAWCSCDNRSLCGEDALHQDVLRDLGVHAELGGDLSQLRDSQGGEDVREGGSEERGDHPGPRASIGSFDTEGVQQGAEALGAERVEARVLLLGGEGLVHTADAHPLRDAGQGASFDVWPIAPLRRSPRAFRFRGRPRHNVDVGVRSDEASVEARRLGLLDGGVVGACGGR